MGSIPHTLPPTPFVKFPKIHPTWSKALLGLAFERLLLKLLKEDQNKQDPEAVMIVIYGQHGAWYYLPAFVMIISVPSLLN